MDFITERPLLVLFLLLIAACYFFGASTVGGYIGNQVHRFSEGAQEGVSSAYHSAVADAGAEVSSD